MNRSTALVTGASGFIGYSVTQALLRSGYPVVAAVRNLPNNVRQGGGANAILVKWQAIGQINYFTSWVTALREVKIVVHCAARVHLRRETSIDSLKEYREVNVAGTLNLARQAIDAGVERFVFLSSVGVNGKQSNQPFTETDIPNPHDPYTVSKFEAEELLLSVARQTEMEVVIIRPPLVYGPNAPGNFGGLIRWVKSGIPLPLGGVNNRRSLVALDNLVDLMLLCADRYRTPLAAGQLFMVADREDVSTTTLLRKVASAAGCTSRLFPVPPNLMRSILKVFRQRSIADSLLGDLQVDATKARVLLGWRPKVSLDEQLEAIFR